MIDNHTDSPSGAGARLIYQPLTNFYRLIGKPVPDIWELPPKSIPEPYRSLLRHQQDMTSTLESYYRDAVHLRVFARVLKKSTLARRVTLNLSNNRPIEFGGIVIYLSHFPTRARSRILAGKIPLGAILTNHQLLFRSIPRSFFKVRSDAVIAASLELDCERELFGRCNALYNDGDDLLAEIVEILAPVNGDEAESG